MAPRANRFSAGGHRGERRMSLWPTALMRPRTRLRWRKAGYALLLSLMAWRKLMRGPVLSMELA